MSDQDNRRRADLAAIHVGKKRLALDDETYRALIRNLTGYDSAADLNAMQRKLVLDHMRRVGFAKAPAAAAGLSVDGGSAQARMVRGLWIELHKAGAVRDSSERALRHFCKRITGADSLRFATPAQLNKLIEALKDWTERHANKVVRVDFRNGKRSE